MVSRKQFKVQLVKWRTNMGFFTRRIDTVEAQHNTGEAIIRLSKSVFDRSPTSEWMKFNADTRAWLYNNNFNYSDSLNGHVPASLDIIPVYDTETKMHVRVPYHKNLELPEGFVVKDETSYNNDFSIVLSRYFMRSCR
jgi:hypothetical protein